MTEKKSPIIKEADYFYDWQGYYPDDGSLDDGIVQPSAPAPAFFNAPVRCPQCKGGITPPGHLVNTDEYEKLDVSLKIDLSCDACGYNWPMEYDQLMGGGERWHVLNKNMHEARGPHKPKQFESVPQTIQGPEGKTYVVIYRGMSDKEYKRWQAGEVIAAGKYFTSFPRQFYVDPTLVRQTDEHTFTFVNNGVLEGDYIMPISPGSFGELAPARFTHIDPDNKFESYVAFEMQNSLVNDREKASKIVEAKLREFPNYYDKIISFKQSSEEDKFSEVPLVGDSNSAQPFLDKDMPNPIGPSLVNIPKKHKPDHRPKVIEPELLEIEVNENS